MTVAAGSQRRAIFRADASSRIGGGHVMRCLTLAEYMAADGWAVGFACVSESRAIAPHLNDIAELLEGRDLQSLDAEALARRWPSGCDILVVDHYSLDARFESSCRGWAKAVVVIDDLADRPHDCDLLLDSTLGRSAADYTRLVPAGALVLVGPDYALLRAEFAATREWSFARRASVDKVERILVSFGLTDIGGVTARVVRPLLDFDSTFRIDVVLGPVTPSRSELEDLAARHPHLRLHVDPPDMARLMAEADLAVGAGGTTSWERCCLGLPTVLLILAENQQLVANRLEQAGAVVTARMSELGAADVVAKVAHFVANAASLRKAAISAAAVVDGRGSVRIITAVDDLFAPLRQLGFRVDVRAASLHDSELVWSWRNDPASRANSRSSGLVPLADHELWFAKMLADPNSFMFIGIVENEPIGVVRFDRAKHGDFEVSINLAPERRGCGLGARLLSAACASLHSLTPHAAFLAQVRTDNVASRRIFEASRFELINAADNFLTYRRSGRGPRIS